MEEILHNQGCMKPPNNGINYQPQLVFSPDFWTINSINLHFHCEGQFLHPNFYSSHPELSRNAPLPGSASSHTVPKHSMALIFLPQDLPFKNAYSHRKPDYRNLYLGPIFTHRNLYLDLVGGFT